MTLDALPRYLRVFTRLPTALLTNPLEMLLAAVFLLNGVLLTALVVTSASAEALLVDRGGSLLVRGWGLILTAAGGLILAARVRIRLAGEDLVRALAGMLHPEWRMERTGLLLFAAGGIIYAALTVAYLRLGGVFSASLTASLAVAALLRAIAITLAVAVVDLRRAEDK